MTERWSVQKAQAWYEAQPWIRGYNTYPSNCVNRIAMWQKYNHEAVIKQARYEFQLARDTGFNAVRMFIQFEVWLYEHDSFMANLEEYIAAAAEFGQKIMFVIGNDCSVPKDFYNVTFGEQKIDWGYHSGICRGQHSGTHGNNAGYLLCDEPEMAEKFLAMVEEFAVTYGQDERVQIWDVWNEIGNSKRGMMSVPLMEKCCEILRAHDVIQPLTVSIWSLWPGHEPLCTEAEMRGVELSDVLSFHSYNSFQTMIKTIEIIRERFGDRPLLNTEWLNRIRHNNVDELFPLFYLENIGSYHWGLMQGFSQTYEPWGGFFAKIDDPDYYGPEDLTKLQHDLYRFNGHPYIAKEVAIIKEFSALADKRFAKTHPKNDDPT